MRPVSAPALLSGGRAKVSVRYSILGPLEVEEDGRRLSLGPPKQRALLGLLLLHAPEPVATTTLVDALWDAPPRTADHSIQSYVSGLRTAMGPEWIVTTANGYQLALDGADLDRAAFERLVAAADEAERTGDPQTVLVRLTEALALWRGEPLADVELGSNVHPRLVRLVELRLSVAERWAAAALAAGQPERVIPELQRLTIEHPLRESLWGLRMQALHAAGRTPEALRVYQELRRVLGEEMGIEPSVELRRLEESLLLADKGEQVVAPPMRNPYKGLRPFGEDDAVDFFGRDSLVRELVDAVDDPGRAMVSVVGPSGSGKSSVVGAGLVPALKGGALPGSTEWLYVVAQPGGRPVERIGSAVAAVTGEDGTLAEALQRPRGPHRLVLVLDQFEEVFTQAPDAVTAEFLDLLADACEQRDVRLVIALRADFYDQPLLHLRFGRAFARGVVHVHPLAADELEAAASGPAGRVGVQLQAALVSELIRDVGARPGSLPLFQYALTEVFDRRSGEQLTLDAYRAIGGVGGALTRRAEEVYGRLTGGEQDAVRQVFYRLVGVGEGGQATRRRATMTELGSLGLEDDDLARAVERLGRHRLVSFDRDPVTGEATVEVAHEALLDAWPRLQQWLDDARVDLRRRAALAASREEWMREGCDTGFLLTGSRLTQYEDWAGRSVVALTADERSFLDASIAFRDEEAAARRADEMRRRKGRRRILVASGAVLVGLLAALVLMVRATGWFDSPKPQIAAITEPGGDVGIMDLFNEGLTRVEQEHDVVVDRVQTFVDAAADLQSLCRSGSDVVLVAGGLVSMNMDPASPECSDTMIVFADVAFDVSLPNVATLTFLHDEGSYLAGAAAALTSQTRVVGFVGGVESIVEGFLDGYAAGAHAVDPDIEIVGVWTDSFTEPALGWAAAQQMLNAGADVIYHAAGFTGEGVLEAVKFANDGAESPIWFIGVDVDEAITASPANRPYVLASMVKRADNAVVDAIGASLQDELRPGHYTYGLAERGVDLTTTGGTSPATRPRSNDCGSRSSTAR
jgi:basic membrane lipoprotein Med (substrate-binding protein (PBP1-ABC) superfamily)/DNA-binding SARP family transcriptional activator